MSKFYEYLEKVQEDDIIEDLDSEFYDEGFFSRSNSNAFAGYNNWPSDNRRRWTTSDGGRLEVELDREEGTLRAYKAFRDGSVKSKVYKKRFKGYDSLLNDILSDFNADEELT